MLQAIYELGNATPHERQTVKRAPADYAHYREGYYTGVLAALRVAELAAERFEHNEPLRRALTRERKREPRVA